MKTIYSILVLLIFSLVVQAQDSRIVDDIVILNDGSEFKGEILEYVPGSHVVIQTTISNPLTFSLNDVEKVIQASSEEYRRGHDPFSYDRLYYNADLSTVVDRDAGFGFAIAGGVVKQFSKWIGIGIGATFVDYINPSEQSQRLAPYLSYRCYLQDKFVSPFIQVNGGYAFNFQDIKEEWQNAYGDGYFVNPKIGVRLGTSDLMYTLFLGAHFHKTSTDRVENPWGSWQNEILVRRTELGVGLLF